MEHIKLTRKQLLIIEKIYANIAEAFDYKQNSLNNRDLYFLNQIWKHQYCEKFNIKKLNGLYTKYITL